MVTLSPIKLFQNYFYFSKATLCIQGLVFSNSLANHAVASILIAYLNNKWKNSHSIVAAIVTNVQEGISSILVILLAHISHNYAGGFKVIATTQAVYILGLLLLCLSAAHMRAYYPAAFLLAVGEAGRLATLEEFLDTQYLSQQQNSNNWPTESQQKFLWSLPWFLGAALTLVLFKTTWAQIFLISATFMAVSYLFFWLGFSRYSINNKKKHSARVAAQDPVEQDKEEAQPRKINIGNTQQQEEHGDQQEEKYSSEDVSEVIGNLWTLTEQVKQAKGFSKEMLAVFVPLFGYGFILGTGSTFFFEQMIGLRNPFSNYDPAVYFSVFSSLSKYIISLLWSLLPIRESSATRVRIGCGMATCMLCCLTAWKIEVRRMDQMPAATGTTSMSIFWLVPQFLLLGAMEGFVAQGVNDFGVHRLRQQDKRNAEYYGAHIEELIVGIVKLLTAVIVLVSGDSIQVSRLDKYYRALTFATLTSFCYYFCVAIYFYKSEKHSKRRQRRPTPNANGNGNGNAELEIAAGIP